MSMPQLQEAPVALKRAGAGSEQRHGHGQAHGLICRAPLYELSFRRDYRVPGFQQGFALMTHHSSAAAAFSPSFAGDGYVYDADTYWTSTEHSYPHYPTVRHRKRFILNAIRQARPQADTTVFDY